MANAKKIRATLLALTCALSVSVYAIAGAPKSIDVPAGQLSTALKMLAEQCGVEFIYSTEQLQGLQTNGVHGEYTAEQAVIKLLEGTNLKVTVHESGALLIATASTDPLPLAEIVVSATPYRFLDADTSGATNLPLPIEAVPQSITLLSADFMRAAGIDKLGDLDRYVAGMSNAGDQGGHGSTERLRGFDSSLIYSRYVDGLPVAGLFYPEFSFFDRVEVVKGPSSVTYGIAPPGGLYNLVSKRAPKTPSARVAGEVGSWNSYRAEAEAGGPINSTGSLRAVGMIVQDAGDSFVHHYDHKDSGAFVGLEYSGDGGLSGAVNARFTKRSNTTLDGFLFYQDGRRPNLPRGFFQGDPDRNRIDARYALLSGHLDFAVTDALELSLKANYQGLSTDYYNVYPFGLTNDGTYFLDATWDTEHWTTYAASLSSLYRFSVRDIVGSFVSVSATYMHEATNTHGRVIDYHGDANTVTNLSDGEDGLYSKLRQWTLGDSYPGFHHEVNVKLMSAQSVMKVTERLSVLAGGSLSSPTSRDGDAGSVATTKFGSQTSLRGGLTYEFRKKSNLYASYSDSFEPQLLVDVNRNLLPPLKGLQWEVGVKSRQLNGSLLLTAAAFRLEQKNAPAFAGRDPVFGDYYRAEGKVRHQGAEFEAMGLVTSSLTVSAAAAFLDAKIAADEDASLVGKRRLFRPRQTASVFAVKGFDSGVLLGFNVGGGVRYIGSESTSYDGLSRDLGSYTVVDLLAGYKSRRWSAQLSINNIFDKFYVQGNNYDTYYYGNTLGEPLNARLRVTWDIGR